MDLSYERRSRTLSVTMKVLLLTVSFGLTVLAITATPMMPLLPPNTLLTPMVEKGSNWNTNEETIEWIQTFRGPYENAGSWMAQTGEGGDVIPNKSPPFCVEEEDSWLIKASKPIEMAPIEIDSYYKLDQDLTFRDDGFLVIADDVTLDLNGHTITGIGGGTGVSVEDRTGVTVLNGTIEDFGCGIELGSSKSSTLSSNTVTHNTQGIDVGGSSDTILSGNTATANELYGFILSDSSSITLNIPEPVSLSTPSKSSRRKIMGLGSVGGSSLSLPESAWADNTCPQDCTITGAARDSITMQIPR